MLKYPHDRVNGYVQLTDANGYCYVPDFTRGHKKPTEVENAIDYCRAFMTLSNRIIRGR